MDNSLRLENRHTGEILHMSRVTNGGGPIVLSMKGSLPPHKSGPPLHVHFHEREEGVVKAGTLGAQIGSELILVQAGDSAAFPAGVAHRWWNAGEDVLEFSGSVIPAVDLDCYLQALFAVVNASESGKPSIFYLAHVVWRHRHTQAVLAIPTRVQRILFPLVLLAGRILGKYRGDDWPGAPAACKGAPEVVAEQALARVS